MNLRAFVIVVFNEVKGEAFFAFRPQFAGPARWQPDGRAIADMIWLDVHVQAAFAIDAFIH